MKLKNQLNGLARNNKATPMDTNTANLKTNQKDGIKISKINSKRKVKNPLKNNKVEIKLKARGEMISNKIKKPHNKLNNKNGDKSNKKVALLKPKPNQPKVNKKPKPNRKKNQLPLKINLAKITNITKTAGKIKSNKKLSLKKEESHNNNKSKADGKETTSNMVDIVTEDITKVDKNMAVRPTNIPKMKNYDYRITLNNSDTKYTFTNIQSSSLHRHCPLGTHFLW